MDQRIKIFKKKMILLKLVKSGMEREMAMLD